MKTLIVTVIVVLSLLFSGRAFAANISPGSTTVGSTLREYNNERREETMENRLKKPAVKRPAMNAPELLTLPDGKNVIYIIKITVQYGISMSDKAEANIIRTISEYEGESLSLDQMKRIASLLTEQYGAGASKAYIPEQSFDENVLYINFVSC